jgi:acetyl esterase/lipase
MSSLLFAVMAGLSCALSLLLYVPPRGYGALQLPYFMLTFLWGELALYNILFQTLSLLLWIWFDAITGFTGAIGMALLLVSWLALYCHHLIGHRTPELLESALREGLKTDLLPAIKRLGRFEWLQPFLLRDRRCSIELDIPYGEDHPANKLDLYLPEAGQRPYPVLLYVHGGAFFMGDKRQQGRLLYQHAVDAGWAVVSINYRLGPDHRMPAMIIDSKRALAWLHQHGAGYGLDTSMIVSAGESAGGFLSLMLACTPGDPFFQPGFESVDTRLQGCISLYAPNDLLGEHGCFDAETYRDFNLKHVMPVAAKDDPELWRRCSPMYRLGPDLPPIFVLGGTHDPLASVEETRQLSAALKAVSRSAVVSAIYPNTTHAFDQTRSSRSIPTMQALLQFMNWVRDTSPAQGGT